jgi:hypothetical protein
MRPPRPINALLGLLVLGVVTAGCGSAQQSSTTKVKPTVKPKAGVKVAAHVQPAHVAFLAPAQGALVGSTVRARVRVSGTGHVRFLLDGGRPRSGAGLMITYRHVGPGGHRLVAELLGPAGQPPLATAVIHFRVRRIVMAAPAPSAAPTAPAPTVTSPPPTSPAPAPTTPAPSTPAPSTPAPSPPATTPSPPPASNPSPPTATNPPAGGGIPQGGGGDGDGDNSGGPSDGDGNV